MLNLDNVQKALLKELTGVADFLKGAFNVRANGASALRQSTDSIRIVPKKDCDGFDIFVAPETKGERVARTAKQPQGPARGAFAKQKSQEAAQVRCLQGREIAKGGHVVLRSGATAFFVYAGLAGAANLDPIPSSDSMP